MDLEFTADQIELRDNIRDVLEGICPPSVVRGIYEGTGTAARFWSETCDLHWPALGVPEASGGLGLSFVEVGMLAEELGRSTAPGPLLATTTQFVPLLQETGASELLSEVAAGERSGALALAERDRWNLDAIETRATRSSDGWVLAGRKPAVLSGVDAASFAVVATAAATTSLGVFLVERDDADVIPRRSLDPALGLADLVLDEAPAHALAEPGSDAQAFIERAVQQATVAMSLHTVGACRRIFEVTLEYAKVREQYGQIIGSFQALKHRFADLYLEVERANAVCYFAAAALAEDDERRAEATHLAKAAAGACQALLAGEGLQLHGGIGFTWENDLHFLLKRAKAGEVLCGSTAYHRARLATALGLTPGAAA